MCSTAMTIHSRECNVPDSPSGEIDTSDLNDSSCVFTCTSIYYYEQ